MSIILSLIALISITILAFKYANMGGVYSVQSPFNSNHKLKITSRQRLVLLLLSVGIIQAGSFSAVLLLVWIVFLIGLLIKYGANISSSRLFLFYGIYLVWLLISLIFSPELGFGLRVFAKYLFPFLVVTVVSSLKINNVFFLKALKVSYVAALIANLVLFLPSILPIGALTWPIFGPIIWWGPAIIDYNPFVMVLAIVLYQLTKKKKYLYVIPFLFLIPIFSAVRTGFIGLGVTLLAISFFKYKLRALPFLAIILIGFIGSIIYIPSIRDKMFRSQFKSANAILDNSNFLTIDDIETNGRAVSWEWALDKFYKGNEYMGSGIGNLQAVFYSGNHPFGRLKVIHNDYIQILCDSGQIGLVLYLLVIISFVAHSFKIYNNKQNQLTARYASFIAGTSLCGIMACAFTDNVINYSLITLSYPYVFFGFALSLKNVKIKQTA